MSTTATHPLAADYLRRLRAAGRHLPADRLDDLCAEIESHLAQAIPPGASDADALAVIERLGSPEEIVEAEQPSQPTQRAHPDPSTWREWAAIILLLAGGFVFGVGWIAGIVLLWSSRLWTTRDKLIGTFIVPGGIAAIVPLLILGAAPAIRRCHARATELSSRHVSGYAQCTTVGGHHGLAAPFGALIAAVVVIGPIVTAIYLARRARTARGAA